jgi:hypothetical protein
MAASDMGHLLGMAEAMSTFSVRSEEGGVQLSLELSADTLARGARLLFTAEIPEILAGGAM